MNKSESVQIQCSRILKRVTGEKNNTARKKSSEKVSTRQGDLKYIPAPVVPFRDMHCSNATWRDGLAAQALDAAILTSGENGWNWVRRKDLPPRKRVGVELAAPRCVRNASYLAY
jgi:hypothetical protein